ncbi:MAG: RNA polymerase sigma-70 factor [Adhaeribacter sp.]
MPQYPDCSDQDLLQLLKQGNSQAFTALYHRYWQKLLVVASNKINDLEEAEEIVHDIFVALWKRRQELEVKGDFGLYLAVSVKYRVMKVLARRYQQRHYAASATFSFIDNSTQEWLQFSELQSQLGKLIADLPEKCQLVYKLSRESGFSHKQIAQELQISEKTVEAHLSKALKSLKAGLNYILL